MKTEIRPAEPAVLAVIADEQYGPDELSPDNPALLKKPAEDGRLKAIHGANRLMGNSLLDIVVFGRIAGASVADVIAEAGDLGALNLDHGVASNAEVGKAGVGGRASPAFIPDSTNPEVRERQLTAHYVGNVRG